jgi:hypothetical protein
MLYIRKPGEIVRQYFTELYYNRLLYPKTLWRGNVTRSRHDIKYKKTRRKAAASRKDDIMTSEKAR